MPLPLIAAALLLEPLSPAEIQALPEGSVQCHDRIVARLGEVGNFDVRSTARSGSRVTLKGTLTAQQRPASPPPGAMTPMHIISSSYNFRCSLHRGRMEELKLNRMR